MGRRSRTQLATTAKGSGTGWNHNGWYHRPAHLGQSDWSHEGEDEEEDGDPDDEDLGADANLADDSDEPETKEEVETEVYGCEPKATIIARFHGPPKPKSAHSSPGAKRGNPAATKKKHARKQYMPT